MPLSTASKSGASPVKSSAGKSPLRLAIVAGVVIALAAGGFLAWKHHHDDVMPIRPAPMTVSTVPSAPVRAGAPHARVMASPPIASQAAVPSGVPQGFAAIQSTGSSPTIVTATVPGPAASPAVSEASIAQSIEAQNRIQSSSVASLNHTLAVMQIQYKIQELASKIQRLQNGGTVSASLPPAPSSQPASSGPAASAVSVARTLTVPLAPQAPSASADALVLVSNGPGGRAAVVRVGGMQYTIRRGEWVGGMRVMSMTDQSVTLAGKGRHETLVLGQ